MQDHVTVVHDDPAVAGESLLFSLFLEFGANVCNGGFGKRVEHAVAGAGADDEIICEGNNVLQIDQDDVFPFFVFQGVYDFTC